MPKNYPKACKNEGEQQHPYFPRWWLQILQHREEAATSYNLKWLLEQLPSLIPCLQRDV